MNDVVYCIPACAFGRTFLQEKGCLFASSRRPEYTMQAAVKVIM